MNFLSQAMMGGCVIMRGNPQLFAARCGCVFDSIINCPAPRQVTQPIDEALRVMCCQQMLSQGFNSANGACLVASSPVSRLSSLVATQQFVPNPNCIAYTHVKRKKPIFIMMEIPSWRIVSIYQQALPSTSHLTVGPALSSESHLPSSAVRCIPYQ